VDGSDGEDGKVQRGRRERVTPAAAALKAAALEARRGGTRSFVESRLHRLRMNPNMMNALEDRVKVFEDALHVRQ
jgi:hypothetical protein